VIKTLSLLHLIQNKSHSALQIVFIRTVVSRDTIFQSLGLHLVSAPWSLGKSACLGLIFYFSYGTISASK